jgi:hypothetical protein
MEIHSDNRIPKCLLLLPVAGRVVLEGGIERGRMEAAKENELPLHRLIRAASETAVVICFASTVIQQISALEIKNKKRKSVTYLRLNFNKEGN